MRERIRLLLSTITYLPHCLWFGSGKLLLALGSTVILDSGSRGTHDHIFLSHDSGSLATTSPLSLGRFGNLYVDLTVGSVGQGVEDKVLIGQTRRGYYPIGLTSFNKIFEKVMYSRLVTHVDK
jgi:hypothetical protein